MLAAVIQSAARHRVGMRHLRRGESSSYGPSHKAVGPEGGPGSREAACHGPVNTGRSSWGGEGSSHPRAAGQGWAGPGMVSGPRWARLARVGDKGAREGALQSLSHGSQAGGCHAVFSREAGNPGSMSKLPVSKHWRPTGILSVNAVWAEENTSVGYCGSGGRSGMGWGPAGAAVELAVRKRDPPHPRPHPRCSISTSSPVPGEPGAGAVLGWRPQGCREGRGHSVTTSVPGPRWPAVAPCPALERKVGVCGHLG